MYDDDFIEECEQATVHTISIHRKTALEALGEELVLLKSPVVFDCCELRISKHFDHLCDDDDNDLTSLQSALVPFHSVN